MDGFGRNRDETETETFQKRKNHLNKIVLFNYFLLKAHLTWVYGIRRDALVFRV